MEEFNILKHEFVPEHVIIEGKEREEVLKKFNINPKNLPKIFSNDPAVKAIEAKEGDILKIIRKSRTAGTSVYYRFVIKKTIK